MLGIWRYTYNIYIYIYDRIKPSPGGVYFWMSRLYSTRIPPVSHRILGIPLYPCMYLHLAIVQQISPLYLLLLLYLTVTHCITVYPASSCIRTYLAVSSCIPYPAVCISQYTVSRFPFPTATPPPRKRADITKTTLVCACAVCLLVLCFI